MAREQVEEPEGDAEEVASAPPRKSRTKQLLVLLLVVLLGQAAIAYVLTVRFHALLEQREDRGGKDQADSTATATVERDIVPIQTPLLYKVGDILVNPPDRQQIRFLNIQVVLQVNSQDCLSDLQDKVVGAQVRDLIFQTLSTTPYNEMNALKERVHLRKVLEQKINASGLLTKGGLVTAVYFDRFILQ